MTGKWNYQPLTHQEKRVKDALAEHVGGNAVVAAPWCGDCRGG